MEKDLGAHALARSLVQAGVCAGTHETKATRRASPKFSSVKRSILWEYVFSFPRKEIEC